MFIDTLEYEVYMEENTPHILTQSLAEVGIDLSYYRLESIISNRNGRREFILSGLNEKMRLLYNKLHNITRSYLENSLAWYDNKIKSLIIEYPITYFDYLRIRIVKFNSDNRYGIKITMNNQKDYSMFLIKWFYKSIMNNYEPQFVMVNDNEIRLSAVMASCFLQLSEDKAGSAAVLDQWSERGKE